MGSSNPLANIAAIFNPFIIGAAREADKAITGGSVADTGKGLVEGGRIAKKEEAKQKDAIKTQTAKRERRFADEKVRGDATTKRDAASRRQARGRAGQEGRSSTILTGNLGDAQGPTARKTLLGA